jgi:hypothetical protein
MLRGISADKVMIFQLRYHRLPGAQWPSSSISASIVYSAQACGIPGGALVFIDSSNLL